MQGPAKLEIGSLTTVYVLTLSQFKFKTHRGRETGGGHRSPGFARGVGEEGKRNTVIS